MHTTTAVRQAVVHNFGDAPAVVQTQNINLGPVPPRHVRIRMIASTINPSDLISISGAYRCRIALPFLPGYEGFGIITELGPNFSTRIPGERVIPIRSAGTWQQYKDHPEDACLLIPDILEDDEAAASYINPMTAWVMIKEAFGIQPYTKIAVSAAGSAIGCMISQIAKSMGIETVGFCRSEQSVKRVDRFGARVLRYESSASLGGICEKWEGEKVDVFLDCVGGEDAVSNSKIVKPGGVYVQYGLLSNVPVPAATWQFSDVRFSLFHLRDWIAGVSIERAQEVYGQAAQLLKSGQNFPRIRGRYTLDNVQSALIMAQNFSADGKVLLWL